MRPVADGLGVELEGPILALDAGRDERAVLERGRQPHHRPAHMSRSPDLAVTTFERVGDQRAPAYMQGSRCRPDSVPPGVANLVVSAGEGGVQD